jgi:hypothetical protein
MVYLEIFLISFIHPNPTRVWCLPTGTYALRVYLSGGRERRKRTRKSGFDAGPPPGVVASTVPPLPGDASAAAARASQSTLFQQQLEVAARLREEERERLARRIYVGSLNYELTEEHIRVPFSAFGVITRIDMPREVGTTRSKGFCFVEYADVASALSAMRTMNGFQMAGRPIKVNNPTAESGGAAAPIPLALSKELGAALAQSTNPAALAGQLALAQAQAARQHAGPAGHRVYVGSIQYVVTPDHIKTVFQAFGTVLSCGLVPNADKTGHKGYGFVEFQTEKEAKDAIENMNNFELCGRPLKVGHVHAGAFTQDLAGPLLRPQGEDEKGRPDSQPPSTLAPPQLLAAPQANLQPAGGVSGVMNPQRAAMLGLAPAPPTLVPAPLPSACVVLAC